MHRSLKLAAMLAVFAVAGCSDSTDPDEPLMVDLQISADHIHALETDVTYTVLVTDSRNAVVSDFEVVRVEQQLAGTTSWRGLTLAAQAGGSYTGTHQFINPGDYSVRVVGKRPNQNAEAVIKELTTPLSAVHSHWNTGGYRVEFDITPGFPDELAANRAYTLKFHVLEQTAGTSGTRAPITGLTGVTIRCTEANGSFQDHAVTEADPGVYQAVHTYAAGGAVSARVSFTGTDQQPAEVMVPITLQ